MVRRTRRRTLKGIGALLVGGSVAGCGDNGGDDNTVEMLGVMEFEPDDLTVSVGTTVVWENVGDVGHTVTAYEDRIPDDADYFASGGFESEADAREEFTLGEPSRGEVLSEESWDHTFDTSGTYDYFCIPHEDDMTGTIEVTGE